MTSARIRSAICLSGALLMFVGVPSVPAAADEAEPPISSYAWYWESQHSQAITDPTSGADVATVEAPNPFCPSTSAGGPPEQAGACHPGRLPVEVANGDYETPEMMSAVAFDLALIPLGSTVKKFEVSFLEAQDRQSEPVNSEGKSLQACLIEQFFGDGDARQYKEAPRFSCSDSDPVAKRKSVQIKTKEGKVERFQYTFDLTPFAADWLEGAPVAGIMLTPVQPKEKDFDPTTDNNWRTVLDGPAEENGVVTTLVYAPGDESTVDPLEDLSDPTDTTTTTSTTTGTDFGTGTTSVDTPTSDTTGTDTPTTGTPTTGTTAEDPLATDLDDEASNASATESGLPGYVWLALLAGIIGFYMFRSVVLESSSGVRPNGVLAQIHQMNAAKRGTAVEAAEGGDATSKFASISGGFKKIGGAASSIARKLPFVNRKG